MIKKNKIKMRGSAMDYLKTKRGMVPDPPPVLQPICRSSEI